MVKKYSHISRERVSNAAGKINSRAIQFTLDSLSDNVNLLTTGVLSRLRLINDISITEGETTIIKHGLGRAYQGYVVIDSNALVGVYTNNTNPRKQTELHLIGDTTAIISLLVF